MAFTSPLSTDLFMKVSSLLLEELILVKWLSIGAIHLEGFRVAELARGERGIVSTKAIRLCKGAVKVTLVVEITLLIVIRCRHIVSNLDIDLAFFSDERALDQGATAYRRWLIWLLAKRHLLLVVAYVEDFLLHIFLHLFSRDLELGAGSGCWLPKPASRVLTCATLGQCFDFLVHFGEQAEHIVDALTLVRN